LSQILKPSVKVFRGLKHISALPLGLPMVKKQIPAPEKPAAASPQSAPITMVEELRQRRAQLDISAGEVMALAGISRTTYWRFASGEDDVSISTARKIERALDGIAATRGIQTGSDRAAVLARWRDLGERLHGADPRRFGEVIAILEAEVPRAEASAKSASALRSILHAGLDDEGS
jgi:transcriptional regulator with XRE-family HTH domain